MLPGFTPVIIKPHEPFSLTLTDTKNAPDLVTGDTSSFFDMDAGEDDVNRRVFALIAARIDETIVSATIGGLAATVHAGSGRTVTTPDIKIWLISARPKSGRFLTVACNFGTGRSSVQCVLYRGVRIFVSGTWTANATTNVATLVDVPANGYIMGGCVQNMLTGSAGATWSGLTEQGHFDNSGAENCSLSFGSLFQASAQTGKAINVSGGSTERALIVATFASALPGL